MSNTSLKRYAMTSIKQDTQKSRVLLEKKKWTFILAKIEFEMNEID